MSNPEIIRTAAQPSNAATWEPVIGREAERFLQGKPDDMKRRLTQESIRILSRCLRPGTAPSDHSRRAGLILGYVQSGKTSSFTTVTALAHDNGFQLVIVIAGTTALLQDQTANRLATDLGLAELDAFRRWSMLKNPTTDNDAGVTLKNLIAEHADVDADHYDLGVPLVVVMKQHRHLANLIDALADCPGRDSISALIVDDEAHMHSPNVGRGGAESPTYAQLKALRSKLAVHTLLQYTATPQAPLLASIADELSPEFVCLLEPGPGYAGGQYFFKDHRDEFVETIPPSELYALDPDQFATAGPPASLRKAFISYLLACSASRHRRENSPIHSSMLVHPHSRKDVHRAWLKSLEAMQRDILAVLGEPPNDPDRIEVLDEDFQPAWNDLHKSDPDFPPLDELIPHVLTVLTRLQIKSVNSAGPSNVNWPMAPYWVLVGGNLLGVGFTVEGLRTSHMMRSTGTRLVDTIQQRARFFGYKASYANTCRAWLQADLDSAFSDYVSHERELRRSLKEIERHGKPLREWKRVFLMDPNFAPTRRAARRLTLDQFRLDREGWSLQQWFVPEDVDLLRGNSEALETFTKGLNFTVDTTISGDTPATTHSTAECSLAQLRELLASDLHFASSDSTRFTALSLLMAAVDDDGKNADLPCTVVQIATGFARHRTRAVDWVPGENGEPPTMGKVAIHQGRNPRTGQPRYLGDNRARNAERLTLQIHRLDLFEGPDDTTKQEIDGAQDLPFLAIYVPPDLRTGVLLED
jgi:hypothetical protein